MKTFPKIFYVAKFLNMLYTKFIEVIENKKLKKGIPTIDMKYQEHRTFPFQSRIQFTRVACSSYYIIPRIKSRRSISPLKIRRAIAAYRVHPVECRVHMNATRQASK